MTRVPSAALVLFMAALGLVAVADRALAGDGAPSTQQGDNWTSRNYPRSWHPDEGASLPDQRMPAAPSSVMVVPAGWPAWPTSPCPPDPCAPTPVVRAPPPCPPPCIEDPSVPPVDVWARWWRATPSGHTLITLGGTPGSGSNVEMDDDLSLDDGNVFAIGLAWRFCGRHRVFAEFEDFSFEGSTTLPRTVVFHGAGFPAGARVESELDLTFAKFGYDYAIYAGERAEVRAGVSGWVWTFRERMHDLTGGEDTRRSFTHVLPVGHIVAEGALGMLHGFARAEYGVVGSDRWMANVSGGVGVRLGNLVNIDGGYRWMRFVFHETTNEGDLTFVGPFLQVSIEL